MNKRQTSLPPIGRVSAGMTLVKEDHCRWCSQPMARKGKAIVCNGCDAPHPHDVAAINKQAKGHEPKEW